MKDCFGARGGRGGEERAQEVGARKAGAASELALVVLTNV